MLHISNYQEITLVVNCFSVSKSLESLKLLPTDEACSRCSQYTGENSAQLQLALSPPQPPGLGGY